MLQVEQWIEPGQGLERVAGLMGTTAGVCLESGEPTAYSVYEAVLG